MSLFDSETNGFVVTLDAQVGDIKFPSGILFAYQYDGANKKWSSKLDSKYVSPFFNISSHQEVDYVLSIKSSKGKNVTLFTSITEINAVLSKLSPGAWVVNELAEPVVFMAANKADQLISKSLSHSSDSEIKGKLFPLSRTETGAGSYELNNTTGNKIANINVEVEYYTSLVAGASFTHADIAKQNSRILPVITDYPSPLNGIITKRYKQPSNKLFDELNKTHPGLITSVKTSTNSRNMNNACGQLKSALKSKIYDINKTDVLLVMYEVLSNSRYVDNGNNLSRINQCVNRFDLANLETMNLTLASPVYITLALLNEFSGYLRTPNSNQGTVDNLATVFKNRVTFVSNVDYFNGVDDRLIDKQELFDQIGKIGANRAGRYHFEDGKNIIYYNHHGALDKFYKIILNNSGSPDNRVHMVKIDYATESELSESDKQSLRRVSEFASESVVKPFPPLDK
ncbi:hypothetical protein DZ860_02480 [Vibrio sinensis]|uniref:Uncharacterized protein n=1 Tax=Vibrio sinensis TaxID=2302434 RepID=A0A3A6REJ8_9VIBR|nr:hypothetical protein [Vibrio sinensis]RJX75562.1 hypothetical protein DZ860_02480 [Vibrio sinensis]